MKRLWRRKCPTGQPGVVRQWRTAGIGRSSCNREGTYRAWLFEGLKWTIALSLGAWLIALLIGSIVGVLRTVPNRWLTKLATGYVQVFRNIPLVVQHFIWHFVLPELLPVDWGNAFKQTDPLLQQFLSAMLCLGLFTSAQVAEQVRAGINSLPPGLRAAGLAMGFTLPQLYRYVLLPMAYSSISNGPRI